MEKNYLIFYAVMLLVGGFIGYKKSKSTISLISGLLSGVLIGFSLYIMKTNEHTGYFLAVIVSGLLETVFTLRLIKTKKFMPSGLLVVLSVIAFVICLLKLI